MIDAYDFICFRVVQYGNGYGAIIIIFITKAGITADVSKSEDMIASDEVFKWIRKILAKITEKNKCILMF